VAPEEDAQAQEAQASEARAPQAQVSGRLSPAFFSSSSFFGFRAIAAARVQDARHRSESGELRSCANRRNAHAVASISSSRCGRK
jgi:hypothetical protein